MDSKAARIIDANLNRVSEGLRVAEDICRYALDNAGLQQALKEMRHRLLSGLEREPYILQRNSLADVGFASQGEREYRRGDLWDVLQANLKRVQEGLRVLEETCKLHDDSLARRMKELRYQAYEVEKQALHAVKNQHNQSIPEHDG